MEVIYLKVYITRNHWWNSCSTRLFNVKYDIHFLLQFASHPLKAVAPLPELGNQPGSPL